MVSKKEIIVLIVLAAIALVRFLFFMPRPLPYQGEVGTVVSVSGIVSDIPDVRLNNKRLTITPLHEDASILAVVPLDADVSYGDEVRVQGILEKPENFMTESGREFNYERYLANKDIYFIINDADMEVVSHGNSNKLKLLLYGLRTSFTERIDRVIDSPESDLSAGLLVGERGGFDVDMRNEFISTGTIHIVALSGYNVTIVAEGVMKILGLFLAQIPAIICGIAVIFLFVLLAGASSTAIRAGIMAIIVLFARMTGRTYDAGRALVIAALLMTAYDPRVVTDISFQLSFLATGGVLFLTPKTIGWVWFLPARFRFRELVATTLAATIAVLPLLLYLTGIFSLVSLPANILILPFIPITMFMSFAVGMLGFISPILSLLFGYLAHLFLSYILSAIHFFASLPFASVTVKSFPLVITITVYGFLIWWVWKKKD